MFTGDHDIKLAAGVEYEWSISLVIDPEQRSSDIIASGWIDRVSEPPELAAELESAGTANTTQVYGKNGLWYDALTAISDQIERSPNDAQLKGTRAALLREVGLESIAGTSL